MDATVVDCFLGVVFCEEAVDQPGGEAVAAADADERAFWVRTIQKGRQEDGDLEHAIALLAKHQTMESTRQDALAWAKKAKTALDAVPDHALKQMLVDLADYVVARIN